MCVCIGIHSWHMCMSVQITLKKKKSSVFLLLCYTWRWVLPNLKLAVVIRLCGQGSLEIYLPVSAPKFWRWQAHSHDCNMGTGD